MRSIVGITPVLGLVAAVFVVLPTAKGRQGLEFVKESRFELRKVVWPNRQETTQTTLVIIFFVIIMGIFFWLLDMFLAWAARMLTGQGG